MPVLHALQEAKKFAAAGGDRSSLSPTSSASTLAPISADQFDAPKYMIRPFHFRLPKDKPTPVSKGNHQDLKKSEPHPSQKPGDARRAQKGGRKRSSSRNYAPRITVQTSKPNRTRRANRE